MFYNTENLFDTIDNPHTNDNEYLPNGRRHWNGYRYFQKLNRIAQVIIAAGQGDFPVVVGLAEIENREVLESLIALTPLKKLDYEIIQHESPDPRGINVAFLYRKTLFSPLYYRTIPVTNSKNEILKTREIVYVKGLLKNDTVHFFVNHWPSKFGGISVSKPLRNYAALSLKAKTDSLLKTNPNSKIIIMGDFNDTPFDKSIAETLGAEPPINPVDSRLYNLALPLAKQGKGTNKFRTKWDLIDQFIVSGNLLKSNGLHTTTASFSIFSPSFLLEKDKTYLGEKLNRTYIGYKYHGGFSDHLPILLDMSY
jgi:hypothetical protein